MFMDKSKKSNSEIVSEAFSKFLANKKNVHKNSYAVNLDPIKEEYSGAFYKKLKMILHNKPLTFYNLHKALQNNKMSCKKIQRIIHKIDCQKEKTDAINKLFLDCEISRNTLKQHLKKKIIKPSIFVIFFELLISVGIFFMIKKWYVFVIFVSLALFTIFFMYKKNKYYQDLKQSIKSSEEFLNSKYHIKNNDNMQEKLEHSKKRCLLVGKLNKLQRLKLQERNFIVLSIKKLIKKIRNDIALSYPDLKQFINFLSYDELSNIKILKEQFNFSPKSIEDFTKEIRKCKVIMKKSPSLAKYYKIKMRLLESVSAEYYKNLTHSKNLQRGYTMNDKNIDRTIHF